MGRTFQPNKQQPYKQELKYQRKQDQKLAEIANALQLFRNCPPLSPTGMLTLLLLASCIPSASGANAPSLFIQPNKPAPDLTTICITGTGKNPVAFLVSNFGDETFRGGEVIGKLAKAAGCDQTTPGVNGFQNPRKSGEAIKKTPVSMNTFLI